MQFNYLKNFPQRMKTVGRYALLLENSLQKLTWKDYGFATADEQINLIFAVLLFIMEKSLQEENCTLDDIAVFLENLTGEFFQKSFTYDDCHELADFIVNTILSNGGSAMYFQGYDFQTKEYQPIHISYIGNRIVYLTADIRRTSYYLTEDGYNLLLGTMEVENNLKISINEIIFNMHLERQSYDKALDDIKNIFNLLHIQIQKIEDAMLRIRRNALTYGTEEYRSILKDNYDTIDQTRQKFEGYRRSVQRREEEMRQLDPRDFTEEQEEKLHELGEIEGYLSRVIDEHQKILKGSFDLRSLYSDELARISDMQLVRRFNLRTDFFEKILDHPESLARMDVFLHPLLLKDPAKIFNVNKAFLMQSVKAAEKNDIEEETEDFDTETWEREQKERRRKRLKLYENSLLLILEQVAEKGRVTLAELKKKCRENPSLLPQLIPEIDIFKEIMVEFLRIGVIDLDALRKEKAMYLMEEDDSFELNEMVLNLCDTHPQWHTMHKLAAYRLKTDPVVFPQIEENGVPRTIRCSNVCVIRVKEEEEKNEL
jgi:hypothetical protein